MYDKLAEMCTKVPVGLQGQPAGTCSCRKEQAISSPMNEIMAHSNCLSTPASWSSIHFLWSLSHLTRFFSLSLSLSLISCPISFCPFLAHALSSRLSSPLKQALQRSLYLHAGLFNDLLIAVVSSKANFGPGLNYKKRVYLWKKLFSFWIQPWKKGVVFWKGV